MTFAVTLSPEQLADQIAQRIQVPTTAPAHLKLAYSIPEAVEISGCTTWDIRTAIHRGELPAKQAGQRGKYTIHHAALDAWCIEFHPDRPDRAWAAQSALKHENPHRQRRSHGSGGGQEVRP